MLTHVKVKVYRKNKVDRYKIGIKKTRPKTGVKVIAFFKRVGYDITIIPITPRLYEKKFF